MQNVRQQLTLFIGDQSPVIEQIRARYNPAQNELIAAHVTLCREDEIEDLPRVISNIETLRWDVPLTLTFTSPIRFDNGKGLLLPAATENIDFDNLRKQILNGLTDSPRNHHPHVTLMHPRNSTCTDEVFRQIKAYSLPSQLSFNTINLIEQYNGGKWNIIEQHPFTTRRNHF